MGAEQRGQVMAQMQTLDYRHLLTALHRIQTRRPLYWVDIALTWKVQLRYKCRTSKSEGFGARPGSFNVLNVSKAAEDAAGNQFFEKVNKPFLDAALKRGDDVVLATIPDIKSKVIDLETGHLLVNFAKELDYLVKNNYKPVNVTAASTAW